MSEYADSAPPGLAALPDDEIGGLLLFRSIDPAALRADLARCPVLTAAPGRILIERGQPNERLFLVLDGELTVHLDAPDSPPLVRLGAGETVGEMSLIDRRTASAWVVAATRCRLLVLEPAQLWALVERFDPVARNLLRTLSGRLRYDNQLIELDRARLRLRVQELEAEREALQLSEHRFQTLYDLNPVLLFMVEPDGRLLSSNDAARAQFESALAQRSDARLWDLYLPDDRRIVRERIEACVEQPGEVERWEAQARGVGGAPIWLRHTARAIEQPHDRLAVVVACEDVTERRLVTDELAYQASHDVITGLLNRRAFERKLRKVLERAKRDGGTHALAYLDLDQFKLINDTAGHQTGDDLLARLAGALRGAVRRTDALARLGGEEFAVLLLDCDVEQAVRGAQAVLDVVNACSLRVEGRDYRLGASVGLVPIDETSESVGGILRAADAACYAAKDAGRNRIHVFQSGDKAVVRRRGEMRWLTELRRALAEERFQLAYQPIVPTEARGGPVRQIELLLRLRDADGGEITPDNFLSVAERYDVIADLDVWVLERALAWLAAAPAETVGLELCALNLSGRSMADERFQARAVGALNAHPAIAAKLCFEINKQSALRASDAVADFMAQTRALGCTFALDDFGSGFVSFDLLKALPVEYVKVAGGVVAGMRTDPVDLAIVKSMVDIARALGRRTVAATIESPEVLDFVLRSGLDFDYLQGNALAPPRPLEAFGV
jgi:diguanylate cyclase (GGDEF)-like protein/PAS domain S-box-containing protein